MSFNDQKIFFNRKILIGAKFFKGEKNTTYKQDQFEAHLFRLDIKNILFI